MTVTETPAVARAEVARGAGLATLARLGAVIEIVAQPLYIWLFGIATYGVYTVLWAAVNIVENIVDLSMTQALQRVVPQARDDEAHAAIRFALLVSVIPAMLVALGVSLNATTVAGWISAAPEDTARLPFAIAIFAWALPLWTFVEVATSAARARRAFGPEIRLRVLWEQVARLAFAGGFFALGFASTGLILAHLASLALTALFCVRLLGRYYDLRRIVRAPASAHVRRELLLTGFATLPAAIARRLFNDLPAIILNLMLPGTRGATAAGLFGIARKIASVPLIVRQAFQYVLAPLASAQAAADRAGVIPLYRFATRMSVALVLPIAGFLILATPELLRLFAPEAVAAGALVAILVLGRAGEAVVGAATPVIEMTGHRGLPLLNSLIGLAAWALLAWWLVPEMAAVGMAIAVSVGTVLTAWAAAVELRFIDRIGGLDTHAVLGVVAASAGIVAMWLAGEAARPLGDGARAGLLLALVPAAMWIALRVGLDRDDRAALGATGRRLRLN